MATSNVVENVVDDCREWLRDGAGKAHPNASAVTMIVRADPLREAQCRSRKLSPCLIRLALHRDRDDAVLWFALPDQGATLARQTRRSHHKILRLGEHRLLPRSDSLAQSLAANALN